jgi:hypothetical protein
MSTGTDSEPERDRDSVAHGNAYCHRDTYSYRDSHHCTFGDTYSYRDDSASTDT